MAYYARHTYAASGAGPYSVSFGYRAKADVEVYIDGELTENYTWPNAGQILLDEDPGTATLVILRNTPKDARLVDFSDGSILNEKDLDLANTQNFYLAQESCDSALLAGASSAGHQHYEEDILDLARQPNVKDSGAEGDGVTDDKTAFSNALATHGGETILIPEGTYKIVVDCSPVFDMPANTILQGVGAATLLKFYVADNDYHTLFRLTTNRIKFKNLVIEILVTDGSPTIGVFQPLATDLDVIDCKFWGNITVEDGPVLSHHVNVMVLNTGSASNLNFTRCTFSSISWLALKSNDATGTHTNLNWNNCTSWDTYGGWGVNSPKGSCTGFSIIGCKLDRNNSEAAELQGEMLVGLASIQNVRIIGNEFRGLGYPVHLEEACGDVTITGNVMETDGDYGIWLLDNNIGGEGFKNPANISITGNIIKTINPGTGTGISLYKFDTQAAEKVNIQGNILDNWEYGIVSDMRWDEVQQIQNNMIHNCTYGLYLDHATQSINNNEIVACTTGVISVNGGVLGKNIYNDCSIILGAGAQTFMASGWSIILPKETHAGGDATENKTLINISSSPAFSGFMEYGVSSTTVAGDISYKNYKIKWDGNALDLTLQGTAVEGGTLATVPDDNGTDLDIEVTKSGAAATDLHIEAEFHGMWTVEPVV